MNTGTHISTCSIRHRFPEQKDACTLMQAVKCIKHKKEMTVKKLLLPVVFILAASCSTSNRAVTEPEEDRLYVTRMYIGDYQDFRHTVPERFGDPHLIWIKTTSDSTFGKISACSKDCGFREGERLYLRRKYVTPGIYGYWIYQIENDSSVFYRVCEYQNDKKVLVQSWY